MFLNSDDDEMSHSSSIGSIGPPTPRPRAATAVDMKAAPYGFYVTMTPINTSTISVSSAYTSKSNCIISFIQPTPPKKPPRRNFSVSPTHMMMTNYVDGGVMMDPPPIGNATASYEYLYLARTGGGGGNTPLRTALGPNADEYVQMMAIAGAQPQSGAFDTTKVVPKSYNPNRKLRRTRDHYEHFTIERATTTTATFSEDKNAMLSSSPPPPPSTTPMSPSQYQQPPTPEHPPPSAQQAERCIAERIRPLSQVCE